MTKEQRLALLRVMSLLIVIGLTVAIYAIRDRAEEFASYGYPGIFLVTLMASATVLLPAPGLAIVFAMGSVFNPLGVTLAGATGATIGELSGYLAGFSGQAVVERMDIYEKITPCVDKYGFWAILVIGSIPNPFFDLAGIAAGVAKMDIWKFLIACLGGQLIKMAVFAYAGYYSINLFLS